MKYFSYAFACLLLLGCAGKSVTPSADTRERLENEWSKGIGSATKSDFVQRFGNAQWCRPQISGEEICRYYKKKGTAWVGEDKRDKTSYTQFEEVVATFDPNGKLRSYQVDAQ